MKKIYIALLNAGLSLCLSYSFAQKNTLSGYITDGLSQESLIRANIFAQDLGVGTITNFYGFYSLDLPPGEHPVLFRYLGYRDTLIMISLSGDSSINVSLFPHSTLLNEVIIVAERDTAHPVIEEPPLGASTIQIAKMSEVPSLGGEVDVLKVMQLMPGVKQGIEGSTGMYVRGGDADQNLILLDEAPVYNVSHLFGFFSVFNPHALKDVTMIKSGFPASYGGRLSSVLDIRMKEGNMRQFQAEGGVGVLSSRLTLQGPILKDKASFIVSARRTYIDQVFKWRYGGDPLPYYFYDLNAKVNYKISERDRIYLSSYLGDDYLRFKADFEESLFGFKFLLGNFTTSFRWNHLFSKKLFCNTSLIHTRFRYDVSGSFVDNSILVRSTIRDVGVKSDFQYSLNPGTSIHFGTDYIFHIFTPNVVSTVGRISEVYKSNPGQILYTHETALYALSDQQLAGKFRLNYGLRFSFAQAQNIFYPGLEPRVNATFNIPTIWGVGGQMIKASYTRLYQYMHLVSSSSIALPIDLWYPVTKNVKPQFSDQYSLGYHLKMNRIKCEFTTEAYYKNLYNLIEYREGAVLILNDNYEDELISGRGYAYGTEFLLSRTEGKFTGWLGYTLSWSKRQFDRLNGGSRFFAKYDRRHDISAIGNYRILKRLSISAVWVFTSGSRFTPLTGQFLMPNVSLTNIDILPVYSEKNSAKFPPSSRLDINIVFKSKPGKRFSSEWHAGGYNIFNRTQPFIVEVVETPDGKLKYQARGLFGFIPSVAYVFKF